MNFDDIKPGSFVPLITGYGITGEFPIDLRTIVSDLQMLQAMIDAHWLYEGLLVYNKNDKKYYQIYINGSGVLAYKLFEIEASQVQQAVESDHLSHTVTINGVETTFAGDTLNINRLVPQQIVNYSDLDNTTNTGQYYGNDGQNNYLLTIEAIGDDKLIRTMTTIENDRVVIKKAIATKVNDEWVWGDWFVADGSVTSAYITLFDTYVSIAAAAGTVNERWIYSTDGSQYPAGKTEIHTNDGQVFTLQGTAPAAAISHPFVVKLHSNGVTKTATVESLAATGSNHGLVTLSESINDSTHGANSGVAASPKAVASLNSALATERSQRQSGDSTLQSNINTEANARTNADTAINNTITDLKNKIRALFGYDVNNVYLATCGTAVQGGDVGLNWANQPTQLNLNDVVAVTFTVNQVTQMGQKSIRTSNGYIYEVNWGSEITANTTKIFVCTRAASGSTTSTWGQLTIGNTMPSRISSVESRISSAETKLAKIPIGMIVMWSGSNVPTGWQLCDGTNGTPNLRDRFIVGSGNSYNIGATGGSNSNRIKINNLPAHSHIYVGDSNIPPHWIWDSNMNGFIVDQSNQNGIKLYDNYGMEIYMPKGDNDEGVWGSTWKNATGVNWTSASIHSWSANGSGDARLYLSSSTIYDKGSRNKTYGKNTPDTIENRPPYYALAFIMFKG